MLGGYAVNLADKYAVEKQLRETHDRFLLLSRATTDAIWEWDMQTGQIFRNDALMDMIGYQPVDSKGMSWWLRRVHPEDRNRVADKVKDSTDAGASHGKMSIVSNVPMASISICMIKDISFMRMAYL
jgi:PAS domain-containing protein